MSLSHEICADRIVGPDGEIPVFGSNVVPVLIEGITLISSKDVKKDEKNFATISFLDKGMDGNNNNIVAQVKTDLSLNSVEFIKNVKTNIFFKPYTLNHVLTLKIKNNGIPIDLGWTCIIIHARRG
jgi:hypothetical protein